MVLRCCNIWRVVWRLDSCGFESRRQKATQVRSYSHAMSHHWVQSYVAEDCGSLHSWVRTFGFARVASDSSASQGYEVLTSISWPDQSQSKGFSGWEHDACNVSWLYGLCSADVCFHTVTSSNTSWDASASTWKSVTLTRLEMWLSAEVVSGLF